MYDSAGPLRGRCVLAVLFLVFAVSPIWGQAPSPAGQAAAGSSTAQTSSAAQAAPVGESTVNDELLARVRKLYFSTRQAGLDGFDCQILPDWHGLFVTAHPGTTIAADDTRIVLLKTVRISIHARLNGGSTVEWVQTPNPDQPPDQDAVKLLADMHQATEQTIQGFLQFWTPFMDGSMVPDSASGLTMTQTATELTIHADQGETKVTEVFSNDLILQHFDVMMNDTSIKFNPSYQPTGRGLLVDRFQAFIQPLGPPPGPVQEMRVEVYYQTIDSVPIPARLSMEVVGTGAFNFTLDGCRTLMATK